MTAKTIVLRGQDDLLSSSVAQFLSTQKDWNVISILKEESPKVLIKAVRQIKPDVVIIHQDDLASNLNLPAELLNVHPEIKVIAVNPNSNLIEVYSKKNIMAKAASDLISIIEADSPENSLIDFERNGSNGKEVM